MSQPINIQDELKQAHAQQMTRRALLGRTTQGLGLVALAAIQARRTRAKVTGQASRKRG